MVHDRACHYLLPRAEDARHASTQCGQRQREDMGTTQNWVASSRVVYESDLISGTGVS